MGLQLVVKSGSKAGQVYLLDDRPIRIGRDPSSTIRLDDNRSSRNHCILERSEDGSWICRDLQSTNHTQLNGEKLVTAVLKEGDVITIGSTELLLEPVTTGPRPLPQFGSDQYLEREISVEMSQESLEQNANMYSNYTTINSI